MMKTTKNTIQRIFKFWRHGWDESQSQSSQKLDYVNSIKKSKWSSEKYSRSARNIRKLDKITDGQQLLITNFFSFMDKINILIEQNKNLREALIECYKKSPVQCNLNSELSVQNFVRKLGETAELNFDKPYKQME